jgi:hypothetical protein
MLGQEPRLRPPSADAGDAKRRAGQERESQRRAEDLAAALAVGAVDLEHGLGAYRADLGRHRL